MKRGTAIASCIGAAALVALIAFVAGSFQRSSGALPLGETVTLVFSKGAWVGCLSHPVSDVEIVSVESGGLVFTESTSNVSLVTRNLTGLASCKSHGIVELSSTPQRFFAPFTAVRLVRQGGRIVWENRDAD